MDVHKRIGEEQVLRISHVKSVSLTASELFAPMGCIMASTERHSVTLAKPQLTFLEKEAERLISEVNFEVVNCLLETAVPTPRERASFRHEYGNISDLYLTTVAAHLRLRPRTRRRAWTFQSLLDKREAFQKAFI